MQITDTQTPDLRLGTIAPAGTGGRWRTEAMRSHATARLIHITRGQGRITVAGLTGGYGPNNLIYLPPHTMYGMEVGPMVFGQMLTLPTPANWPATTFHLRLTEADRQKEVVGLMEAIEREIQPTGDTRAAQCHLGLLEIFVERQLQRGAISSDQRRNTAAARLVARYTDLIAKEFRVHDGVSSYAKALDVTPTHLTRCCRKTCGKSALALLNDRIHFEACMMLRETVTPIQDIATTLGFGSPAYFTRSFQEKSGQTPSAFRRDKLTKRSN